MLSKEIFSTLKQFKNGQEIKVKMNLFQRIYVNVSGNIRYIILKKKKFKNHRKIMWEKINIEICVH